jgi:hypothetical protein
VAQRYLTGGRKRQFHNALAIYFQSLPHWCINEAGNKILNYSRVSELPWQHEQAQNWEDLKIVLSDVVFLNAAWGKGGHEVMKYWTDACQ